MNIANETQFLKAFEVVLTSDMQVYLIATAVANVFLFILVAGIVYFICVKRAIHDALHRAIIQELEEHRGHHSGAQYTVDYPTARATNQVTLATTNFMQKP